MNIGMFLKSVVSYFPVSKPTKEEYEISSTDSSIVLTYDSPAWDPDATRLARQKKQCWTIMERYKRRSQENKQGPL